MKFETLVAVTKQTQSMSVSTEEQRNGNFVRSVAFRFVRFIRVHRFQASFHLRLRLNFFIDQISSGFSIPLTLQQEIFSWTSR